MHLDDMLQKLCEVAAAFHACGYAFGSTGNLSLRFEDEIWITPTGGSLRNLTPASMARIDGTGQALNAIVPPKKSPSIWLLTALQDHAPVPSSTSTQHTPSRSLASKISIPPLPCQSSRPTI